MALPNSVRSQITQVVADTEVPGFGATNAVDGDISTTWKAADPANALLTITLIEPVVLAACSITSSTDTVNDPNYIALWASDDGVTFGENLLQQSGVSFTSRGQTKTYAIISHTPYQYYILQLGASGDSQLGIAEFDIATDPTNLSNAISARTTAGTNPYLPETEYAAFDGDRNTSWSSSGSTTKWLQAEFRWGATADSYGLVPRSDGYGPTGWQLKGSNDAATWTVLDTQIGQTFTDDQRNTYPVSAPEEYRYYRIQFTAWQDPTGTMSVTEWELFGVASPPGVSFLPMQPAVEFNFAVPPIVWFDPFQAEVDLASVGGRVVRAELVPISTQVSSPTPALVRIYRELVDPLDGSVVPVMQPVFTVLIGLAEGPLTRVTVEVQYYCPAVDSLWRLFGQDVDLVYGVNTVRLTLPVVLPDKAQVSWQARLVVGGQERDWIDGGQFTVDSTAGDHTAQVTWDVKAGDPDPHLWYVTPTAGIPGDLVTVVGQGFSYYRGTVQLAGIDMPVQRWAHIPATGLPAERVIDSLAHRVDPEHDEVVVIVPDAAPPGGLVRVIDAAGTTSPDAPPVVPLFVPPLEWASTMGEFAADMPGPSGSNNDMDSATPITMPDGGGTVVAAPVSNAGYTMEPVDDFGVGYRSAWWALTLDEPGTWSVTFDATSSTQPVWVMLYVDGHPKALAPNQDPAGTGRPDPANPDAILNYSLTSYYGSPVPLLVRLAAVDDSDATYNLRIVAAKTWSPSGPAPLAGTNDSFGSPTLVEFIDSGATVVCDPVSNVGYTAGIDEPPPGMAFGPAPGYRSAWWKVSVTGAGNWQLTADATGSTTAVHVSLYGDNRAVGGSLMEGDRAPSDYYPDAKLGPSSFSGSDSSPNTFLIRVASDADVDATYHLTITTTLTP